MHSDNESAAPENNPDGAAQETWPIHQGNCPGDCGGRGYRYGSSTDEAPESCTGRPYRFAVRGFTYDNWDAQHASTLFHTDSEQEVAGYRDGQLPEVWVEDREFVPPPRPVDLLKYDFPF